MLRALIMFYLFLFFFGTAVGSFLNVLIDRLPKEQKITGRSYCDHCHHQLAWYDLIPIVSFFLLKGRCRYCGKKISWQYPVVEFITGIIFLLIYYEFSELTSLLIYWGLISCLIVIFVSDLKYQLISDYVLWAFFIFSFIYRVFYVVEKKIGVSFEIIKQFQNDIFFSLISSLIVSLPIFLIYFLSKEKAMGLGDVYLVAIIGFLLGWQKGFLALYIGILLGGLTGLLLIIFKKNKLKSKIAFGPFLVIGTVVMLFYGEEIFSMIQKIYGF